MLLLNVPSSLPRWVSALVWLVLGFSACAWYLRAQGVAEAVVTPPLAVATWPDPDSAQVASALGAVALSAGKSTSSTRAVDVSRLVLKGVIDRGQGRGAALISVDTQPAKPFATGSTIADGMVLVRVRGQSAWVAKESSSQEGVELLLVPADSKKPLTVTGSQDTNKLPAVATVATVASAPTIKLGAVPASQ